MIPNNFKPKNLGKELVNIPKNVPKTKSNTSTQNLRKK